MLSKQLQEQIEQEAAHEARMHFHPQYSRDQNTACRINYKNGAEKYAALYEAALTRAERAEKALRLIEQMSDPGDYWLAVCRMKSIASDALTPKTGEDENT